MNAVSPSRFWSPPIRRVLALALACVFLCPCPGRPGPAATGAVGEVASQWVQKFGCDKVKEWAQGNLTEAMQAWADYIVTGVRQESVYGILGRGVADDCIANMGTLTTLIQSIEEAASGDLWKAVEIAGEGVWEMQLALLGGPHVAAVWAVCKELNDIATQLNEEIVYINLKTAANWAEQDPALLGQGRVDHFLNAYLAWDDRSPYGLNTRVRQFRTMYYEYIKVALNQTDFPDVNDWPAQRNRVRTAAEAMLSDVGLIVKGRERQKLLGDKARLLRADLDAIREFQSWWDAIKGVTCADELTSITGDPVTDCTEAAAAAADLLADAEQVYEGLSPLAGAAALREEIHRHSGAVDAGAARLEGDLAAVAELCRADDQEWQDGRTLLERVEGRLAVLNGLVAEAEAQAGRACGAADRSTAGFHADQAARTAGTAGEAAGDIANGGIDFMAWEPPRSITFDRLLSANDGLLAQVRRMMADAAPLHAGQERVRFLVSRAEEVLRACDLRMRSAVGDGLEFGQLLEIQRSTATGLLAGLERKAIPSEAEFKGWEGELTADEIFLREQIERQKEGRACLDALPDLWEMVVRMDRMERDAGRLAEQARSHAERARACAEAFDEEATAQGTERPEEEAGAPDQPWEADGTGAESGAGAWVAVGEVETIDEVRSAAPPAGAVGGGERGILQPSGEGSSPEVGGWIRAADGAFNGCDFETALRVADAIAARDPSNAWVAANYRTIADNAARGREALAALQRAQSALQAPDLTVADVKAVRQSIQGAAQVAPNCMVDRINGVLDQVSAGMAGVKQRDRAKAAGALGGLISTLVAVGAAVQASTQGVPPSGAGSTFVPSSSAGGGGGAPPMGSGTGGATLGDYCSITIVGYNPDSEEKLTCWALVDFYVQGTPRVDNYMVIPVTKKQTLQQAIAMYSQMGAANRLVATGSRSEMKSSALQACPRPSRYTEN